MLVLAKRGPARGVLADRAPQKIDQKRPKLTPGCDPYASIVRRDAVRIRATEPICARARVEAHPSGGTSSTDSTTTSAQQAGNRFQAPSSAASVRAW